MSSVRVEVDNPKGNKKMAAKKKKKTTAKKKNPTRRAPAKKKKPTRRRRRKNPAMHPLVSALLGSVAGGGAGVGTVAALRYFGVGSPKSRGIGMLIAGPVVGAPVAFLSPAFGAGLGAGMSAAGGAELTSGIKPRKKNGNGNGNGNGNEVQGVGAAARLAPRFGPRTADDLRATRAARPRGGVLGAVVADEQNRGRVGAVVADDIGRPPGANLSGYQRVQRVEGLGGGVGIVVDRNGNMYVDDAYARNMSSR